MLSEAIFQGKTAFQQCPCVTVTRKSSEVIVPTMISAWDRCFHCRATSMLVMRVAYLLGVTVSFAHARAWETSTYCLFIWCEGQLRQQIIPLVHMPNTNENFRCINMVIMCLNHFLESSRFKYRAGTNYHVWPRSFSPSSFRKMPCRELFIFPSF